MSCCYNKFITTLWNFLLSSQASNFGTFLMGIAAIIGFWWGSRKYNEYLFLLRQQSAIALLYSLRIFLDNIKEIVNSPVLYEFDGNYPGLRLEIDQQDCPRFKYRPIRLITNELGLLKKEWVKLAIIIAGKEASQLDSIFEALVLDVKSICNYLGTHLGDQSDREVILRNYDSEKLLKQLDNMFQEIEVILKALIQ